MHSNIALVGAAKANTLAISEAVTNALDMFLLDSDGYVEYEFVQTIPQILQGFGNDYFYKLEAKKLARFDGYDNAVLTTSPTCLMDINNIDNIKQYAIVVVLFSSRSAAYAAIVEDRTLVLRDDVISRFDTVYENLNKAAKLADICIDITNKKINVILQEIIAKLGELN